MSTIAVPTTHASYSFRAAMLLGQQHAVVCEWKGYHFHVEHQPMQQCELTIALEGQKPHIRESFEDDAACEHYLCENSLPTSGWCPVELVRETRLTY